MNIKSKIITCIRKHRLKKWTLKHGMEFHLHSSKISKLKQIKLNRSGFNEIQNYIFNLNNAKDKKKQYLSQFDRWQMRNINGAYKIILDDKRLFEIYFAKHVKIPQILFYIMDSKIYDSDFLLSDNEQVIKTLKKCKLFFRTNEAGGGTGAHLFELKDNQIIMDSNIVVNNTVFNTLKNGNLSMYLDQLDYSKKIYSYSTNTIRIITINDGGNYKIVACAHRFGTNESKFVDNASSGGIFCSINTNTGIMGKAYSEYHDCCYLKHPDTLEQIEGVEIPFWQQCKEKIIDLHKKAPYFKLVAWDVVLQQDGQIAVIEGNASSDITLIQTEKGLKNEELGLFLKKNGCLF